MRQQVQCQGTSLQIAGVRGATGGLLGTAGIPVGRLQGYYVCMYVCISTEGSARPAVVPLTYF